MEKKTCQDRLPQELAERIQDIRALMYGAGVNEDDDLDRMGAGELALIFGETEEAFKRTDDGWTLNGDRLTAEKVSEAASDRTREYPLGVSVRRVLRVELSWGGPSDYFEADLDEDGGVSGVTYHFLDWFDGAEASVTDDDVVSFVSWFADATE